MYIVDSDLDLDSAARTYKSRDIEPRRIIEAFQESGKHQVEIVFTCHEYKNAYSCRNTFGCALTRMGVPHIKATTLNGHVYLVNELVPRKTLAERKRINFYKKRKKGENRSE